LADELHIDLEKEFLRAKLSTLEKKKEDRSSIFFRSLFLFDGLMYSTSGFVKKCLSCKSLSTESPFSNPSRGRKAYMSEFRLLKIPSGERADPVVERILATPYEGKRCPFYGLEGEGYWKPGTRCALGGENGLCVFEVTREEPNWDTCWRHNTVHDRARIADLMQEVYLIPPAMGPHHQGWSGIPLNLWFAHVMGHEY
jgi:hypothetical protein